MEEIFSWIKSGLLFGLFSSVILLLCPNKVYQKHIGMVTGLLFLLIMLRPLISFLSLEDQMYIDYIQNFLMLEVQEEEMTESEQELYEESIILQLKAVLQEKGYPIEEIEVSLDDKGKIEKITFMITEQITGLNELEYYLKEMFGEEIIVCYESG